MAPATRRKAATEAEKLNAILNSSPEKVKASSKKREQAERRAEEAAKKQAEKEKAMKKKLAASAAAAKALSNVDDADYSTFEKETAILLKKSDVNLQHNVAKMLYYTDVLDSFNHKKWPKAAVSVKSRIKRYTDHVEALRKAKAALLKSAKSSKGKKKATTDFDPTPFISSGEFRFRLGPPTVASGSSIPPLLPLSAACAQLKPQFLLFPLDISNFIFHSRAATARSASRLSPRPWCLVPGFAPFLALASFSRLRAFFGFAPLSTT
jgi:hypothetical protein